MCALIVSELGELIHLGTRRSPWIVGSCLAYFGCERLLACDYVDAVRVP